MRYFTITLLGLAGVACTPPKSADEVATSEMVAYLDVTSDGATSVSTASFTYGSGVPVTYVQLGLDDTLTTTVGELTKEMGELVAGDLVSYVESFDVVEADAAFTVSLTRIVDAGAPASVATLPPPFEITGSEPDQTFSRGAEDITLSWTGETAGDRMTLTADGDCIDDYELSIDEDTGAVTVPAGSLPSTTGKEAEACEVTFWLKRDRSGELDPAFAGGTFSAKQYRTLTVYAEP